MSIPVSRQTAKYSCEIFLDVLTIGAENTIGNENSPKNNGEDASNQPGLKEMTLKAVEGETRLASHADANLKAVLQCCPSARRPMETKASY